MGSLRRPQQWCCLSEVCLYSSTAAVDTCDTAQQAAGGSESSCSSSSSTSTQQSWLPHEPLPGQQAQQPQQSQQQQQQQMLIRQKHSLYTASNGDYSRVLQLQRQVQQQYCHQSASLTVGGDAAPLQHCLSSPCLAYSNSIARSSTSSAASTSSHHSTACTAAGDHQAVTSLAAPKQSSAVRQRQQQTTRLPRSSSWPWLFSCSSISTRSDSADKVEARNNISSRQLMFEGGLAAVAGAAVLHPAVQAYLQGTLGIAFSGGGFRFTYFIGVMDILINHLGVIGPNTLLSGASCGALIAVFTKCGMPVEQVLTLTQQLSQECSNHGVKGRLGTVLREHLQVYLPEDAHLDCDGNTFIAVTQVWPAIRTRLFSSFPTRADLINAVMASCHLPTLSDGTFTVNFKNRLHIDGGLLSVLTTPPKATHTVAICSMPSRQIAKLPAFIGRPAQADISISPDTYQTWPFTRSQTTGLALQPPSPDFIEHMVARGRADALSWAEAVGLTRNGVPVFPTAAKLDQLRQQVFGTALPCGAATRSVSSAPQALPQAGNNEPQMLVPEGYNNSLSKTGAHLTPPWELFLGTALQAGVSRQQQLQQQGLHYDSSTVLAAEAATAPAAEAAAEAARKLRFAVAGGLQKLQPIQQTMLVSTSTSSIGSNGLIGHASATGSSYATTAAVAGPAESIHCASVAQHPSVPAAPGSVSGSSEGRGSSGDWQLLVAELGISDAAELQQLAVAPCLEVPLR